jgi:two-component system phosphate regulon sensor histidine kinase PhoR
MFAVGSGMVAGLIALGSGASHIGVALVALAAGIGAWIARARGEAHVIAAPEPQVRAPDEPPWSDVLEALPDALLVLDRDGRIIAANQPARERLSLGAAPARFDAAVRRPDILDAATAAAADGQTRSVELVSLVPVERHERMTATPFEAGGKTRLLIHFADLTELKVAQRQRADFVANASHELRTPLASLSGFIDTLRGHARDDAAARDRFLDIMATQADRMRRLIDDLLALSRIELNENVPPSGRTDIAALVQEAADAVAPLAEQRRARVDVAGVQAAAWVVGDWDELTQVMQNLVDNALKYSPEGGVVTVSVAAGLDLDAASAMGARAWPDAARITLHAAEPVSGRRFAVVRVADQGPGIDRRHLPRLSERFYRVQSGAERAGTGLGLAIVKHIVSRHRGGFSVESLPGRGTGFAVMIPQPTDLAGHVPRDPSALAAAE